MTRGHSRNIPRPGPPMAFPAPTPQDVIDTIIGNISANDAETLKHCSLVSRSFLLPSQKQLFSIIYITRGRTICQRLHRLITSSPHIATYIRELHVILFSDPPHFRGIKKWVYGEQTFPALLRMLEPWLRSFSLAVKYDSMSWARFPSDLQSVLLDLCTSPNLISFRLVSICAAGFPLATFSAFKQLKRLGFLSCTHTDCWTAFTPLPLPSHSLDQGDTAQLESVELGGYTSRSIIGSLLHPNSSLAISHLRTISIKSDTWATLDAILSVHEHIAQSVESLMWLDARHFSANSSRKFLMGTFPRLRFLGFCISIMEESSEELTSVVRLLLNGSVPNSLEELTIIVESDDNVWQDGFEPAHISDICLFLELSGLQAALVTGTQAYDKLRKVNIFVDVSTSGKHQPRDDEDLQSLLIEKLPLLAAKVVLSGRMCDKIELLARISSVLPSH